MCLLRKLSKQKIGRARRIGRFIPQHTKYTRRKTGRYFNRKTFELVKDKHPKDWLLSVEIAELCDKTNNTALLHDVLVHLEKVKQSRPEIAHLIAGGLGLFLEKVSLQH